MTSELLAAVLNAPYGDYTPRLVYADWLTERGDPRGEFIHLQCALGRALHGARGRSWGNATKYDGDPVALEKREKVLLKKHQKEWVAPIREHLRTWSWFGGFIESAVCDGSKFIAGSKAIFDETPLIQVQLTAMKKPLFEALIAQPTTSKLRHVDLSSQKIESSIAPIFHAPCWANVRVLNLHGNHIDREAIEVLHAARFDSLESLDVGECPLTDDAIEALTRAPFFSRLKTLRLGWSHGLTSRSCDFIAAAGDSLVELDLAAVRVGNEGATALASSAKLKNLRSLRLDWNVTRPGVTALLESPHLTALRSLDRVDGEMEDVIKATFAARS